MRAPAAFCLGLVSGMALGASAWAGTATVSVGSASVNEGNSGTTTLNVPVTRSGDTTGNVVVEYRTADGDTNPATAGFDYTAVPAGSILRIPAGQSSANIGVQVLGDTLPEANQTLLVQLTRATAFSTTASFAAAVNLSASSNPAAVAIGDLDGDGRSDLAVANIGAGNVSVLRNTSSAGTASFAAAVNFATSGSPSSVAIGDLDGDGKPDLAVSNADESGTLSVLRNTSISGVINAGSFAPSVTFSVGSYAQSVAIGDVDGDGKADLAAANAGSASVSVLRNTSISGTVSFAGATSFNVGNQPYSVAIGDIDGDGKRDLAVANRSAGNVSVLRGSSTIGTVTFETAVNVTIGDITTAPQSVKIGDLDGDGKPDLAVADDGIDAVSVLRNTSAGGALSFASALNFGAGDEPQAIAIGDLDGNGKPDLAVANYNSNLSVLLSTSSPGTLGFVAAVNFNAGTNPFGVDIGDLDGDGKPDVAAANGGSSTVSVLRNSPGSTTSLTSSEAVGTILDDDEGTVAAPTLTLSVSPTRIERGDSATLTWASDNAASCTASNAWTGAEAFSGSLQVTPTAAGTYTYTLTCTNPSGDVVKSAVLTVDTPEPTLTILVSPTSVTQGAGATLSWASTDAVTCDASGAWSGSQSVSDSITVTPATVGTHTYTLSCDGLGGTVEESATLTVTAPEPSVTISVSPASIVQGGRATLTWASDHVSSCTASDAWGGAKPLNGAILVKPAAGTYTYILECTGAGGPKTATATLTVTPPPAPGTPSLKFVLSPVSIAAGQSAVLAWSSAGTNTCTASGAWSGTQATTGSQSVSPPAGTHTYTLTCQGPGGSKVVSVKLTVGSTPAKPTVMLTLSPTSIDVGGDSAALRWSSINASSCAASGAWSGSQTLSGSQFVQPSTAGTYTYTLSCSGSGGTTAKSVNLTVTRKAPVVGLSVLPARVVVGRSITLAWSALYANTCTATGTWAGSRVVAGTENRAAPTLPGTYTYSLACTGAGGIARKSVSLTVTPEPLPTVNFFVTPTGIKAGNSADLSWSSTNATSCAASGAWTGPQTTSGTQSVSPSAAGTYTYTLACTGPGGTTTKSAKLTVAPPLPTLDFSVSPTSVSTGETATLTWSSTHSTSCTASGAWSGTKALSGTLDISRPAAGSFTYTLACTGAGGTITKSSVLSVTAAPPFSLTYTSASCTRNGAGFPGFTYTATVSAPIGSKVADDQQGSPTSCGAWTYFSSSGTCERLSGNPASTSVSFANSGAGFEFTSVKTVMYVPGSGGTGTTNYSTPVSCPP